jgi:tight adherence protein B
MAFVLGLLLGAGLVCATSPLLWPRTAVSGAVRRRSPLSSSSVAIVLRARLVQAGLGRISLSAVAAVSVLLGIGGAALCAALVPVVALALAAGTIGLALPSAVILWRASAARRAARVVWPDVVDHLLSAIRSGLALPDSVVTLAHSGPAPTREAFREFETEYRATGNFSSCLDRLKNRLVDPVADRIIETLRMSREVGGQELPTVLRNLAAYLRDDAAVRAEIEARQSWTVNAARLGVAAPWIVLVLLATRPEAAAAYNTPAGTLVIVAGAALSVIAYWLMLVVGRLPEERRWFQ